MAAREASLPGLGDGLKRGGKELIANAGCRRILAEDVGAPRGKGTPISY